MAHSFLGEQAYFKAQSDRQLADRQEATRKEEPAKPISWKPEFLVQGEWARNGQAFATEAEALKSAASRFMRWTIPADYRAVESDEPVNYIFDPETGEERMLTADEQAVLCVCEVCKPE